MDKADGDSHPPPSRVDKSEFSFPGSGLSALLIHGLTGTPYEMRYLGERLAASGVRVRGVRLAGHAGAPEELGESGYDNWYESVVEGFESLRQHGDPIVAVGLSAGAVLAARLTEDQGGAVSGLVALAPAFFLPRRGEMLLRALRPMGRLSRALYIRSYQSDIHDDDARRIHPTTHLMPLRAPMELMALSKLVRPRLKRITQPALVIHSRPDHTCPFERNTRFVMGHLGSARKRLVALEKSFHVITVDIERERVVQEVLDFLDGLRAASPRQATA